MTTTLNFATLAVSPYAGGEGAPWPRSMLLQELDLWCHLAAIPGFPDDDGEMVDRGDAVIAACAELLAEEAARAADVAAALDDIARPAYALNALDVGVDAALGSLCELLSEWDAGDDRDRLGAVYDALAAARAHALAVANGQASLTGTTP